MPPDAGLVCKRPQTAASAYAFPRCCFHREQDHARRHREDHPSVPRSGILRGDWAAAFSRSYRSACSPFTRTVHLRRAARGYREIVCARGGPVRPTPTAPAYLIAWYSNPDARRTSERSACESTLMNDPAFRRAAPAGRCKKPPAYNVSASVQFEPTSYPSSAMTRSVRASTWHHRIRECLLVVRRVALDGVSITSVLSAKPPARARITSRCGSRSHLPAIPTGKGLSR